MEDDDDEEEEEDLGFLAKRARGDPQYWTDK